MAVVINGSGTVTGLSVGGLPDGTVDAGTLATDSVTAVKIPDTVEADLKSGRKNLIINGGMDVWQRGTSFSSVGYAADRVRMSSSVGTVSQSTDVPAGFKYSAYFQTLSGSSYTFRYIIEDSYRHLSNSTFTISFYIKGDSAFTGSVEVNDEQSGVAAQTFSVTTSWTRVEKTFSNLTAVYAPYGNDNDFLDINDGVATNFKITGVQLELGSTATDFEHRSYGEELALCQRYYQKSRNPDKFSGDSNRGGEVSFRGYTSTSSSSFQWYPFPVTMRIGPTITIEGTGPSGISTSLIGTNGFRADYANDNYHYAFYYYADAEL